MKRLEQFVGALRLETGAHILHEEDHTIGSIEPGSYDQLSGTIIDRTHRVCGVQKQIQDDLL